MADNEEKIAVVPFKGDFLRTQADWLLKGKYPTCRLRNVYGMTRAEAVERMAKAACKSNRRCIGGICETCTSNMPKEYMPSCEAALDALLGEKK